MIANRYGSQVEDNNYRHQQQSGGINQGARSFHIGALETDVINVKPEVHELSVQVQKRRVAVEWQRRRQLDHTDQHQGRNLARRSADREELIEQLRITLFHEVGHFLGLDEDDLEARGLE